MSIQTRAIKSDATKLTVFGSAVKVVQTDSHAVMVLGEVRLHGGRRVSLRADGRHVAELTVLWSQISELHSDRLIYEAHCEIDKPLAHLQTAQADAADYGVERHVA